MIRSPCCEHVMAHIINNTHQYITSSFISWNFISLSWRHRSTS